MSATSGTGTGEATTTTGTGTTPTTGEPGSSGAPTTGATEGMTTTGSATVDTTEGTGEGSTVGTTGAIDPPLSLDDIVDGALEKIAEGHGFTEGPVWSPEGYLLYSDIPADTIFQWTEGGGSSAFITPSGNSNGLIFDAMGRLLAGEHGGRRISRRVIGMDAETVVDQFEGKKLNSPNDLVLRSDGTIYFTDPPYGIQPQQQELAFQGVFRVAPGGEIALIADDFDRPNGIVLSPDESTLYVADTAKEHVRSFAVQAGGEVTGGAVFVDLKSDLQGNPDGMAVDVFGDIYVTGGGGVRVVTPAGAVLGTIMVPEGVTNCTFGDPDGMALFLTAPPNVYRLRLKVKGAGLP
jgi:gluconolactonase